MNYDKTKKYYVYQWINDDTGLPFYIGKGTGNRYKSMKHRNDWFKNIINKHPCHPEIIIQNLDEQDALDQESKHEEYYRVQGYNLCNLVPCGGEPPHGCGEQNSNYGNYWSEEKKRQVSQKMIDTKCHAGARNGRCRKCMRVEDGKIYKYMTEALADLNLSCVWSIGRCLKNPYNVANGYHFVGEEMFDQLNTEEKRNEYLYSICSHSRVARRRATKTQNIRETP